MDFAPRQARHEREHEQWADSAAESSYRGPFTWLYNKYSIWHSLSCTFLLYKYSKLTQMHVVCLSSDTCSGSRCVEYSQSGSWRLLPSVRHRYLRSACMMAHLLSYLLGTCKALTISTPQSIVRFDEMLLQNLYRTSLYLGRIFSKSHCLNRHIYRPIATVTRFRTASPAAPANRRSASSASARIPAGGRIIACLTRTGWPATLPVQTAEHDRISRG